MTDGLEPQAKKLRFSKSCPSNEVIYIRIVDGKDKWNQVPNFHPAFSYHAFGKEEVIEGYDGLRIQLTFNAKTFDCLVEVSFDSKNDDAQDLVELMRNSLPRGYTQDKNLFLNGFDETSSKPPGSLVDSYSRNGKDFDTYYSVLEKDDVAKAYLEKLQKLSMWFIEGADDIDVNDARWSLYVMYNTVGSNHYPLGFITVFTFNTPLKTQTLGQNMRICQALVLPPYQRQGHGERLVEHIMHQARSLSHVFEVTVEDPVPGFSMLRDVVDVKTCLSHGFFNVSPTGTPQSVAHGTKALTTEDIQAVKTSLKLTKQQIQRCYEILKLRYIDRSNEDEYKAYRLEVKRRLHHLHAEDLEAMGSADRRKSLLSTLYDELEQNYICILKRCGLLPRTN